jgi:hypothetical protein
MARKPVQTPYKNRKLTVCERLQKFSKANGEWLKLLIDALTLAVRILALLVSVVALIVLARRTPEPVRLLQRTSTQTEITQAKDLEQATPKKTTAIIGKKVTPQRRSR